MHLELANMRNKTTDERRRSYGSTSMKVALTMAVLALILLPTGTEAAKWCINTTHERVRVYNDATSTLEADYTNYCPQGCIKGGCIERNAIFEVGTMAIVVAVIFLSLFKKYPFYAGMLLIVVGVAGTAYDLSNPFSIIIAMIGFIVSVFALWGKFEAKKTGVVFWR